MKSIKIAVVACSLFAAALAAHAQTEAPASSAPQQVSQTAPSAAVATEAGRQAAPRARNTDSCVGPASFCHIYFGS